MFSSDLNRRIPKKKARLSQWILGIVMTFFLLAFFFWGVIFGNEPNGEIIILPMMIVFIAFALGFTLYEGSSWKDRWEELAQQTGLTYAEERKGIGLVKRPVVSGTYKGHPVKFDSFTRGSGRYRRYYTEIQVILTTPPTPNALKIERGTWFNRIGKSPGKETVGGYVVVEMGDAELDRLLVIQSRPAMFVHQIFAQSTIRQGIEETVIQAREMNLTVENNRLHYYECDRIRDTDYLRAVLDMLIEMVNSVERGN